MKIGDKVKCIGRDAGLTIGNIYTVEERAKAYAGDDRLINVKDDKGESRTYYKTDFELVKDTFQIIKDLAATAQTYVGQIVSSDSGRNWKVDSYEVILVGGISSASVREYFNTHGYCVAVKGGGRGVPVENVKLIPTSQTIKLTNDYDAVVTKDTVVVGCQTISREKLLELLKVQDGLQ